MRYAARRLGFYLVTAWAAITVNFLIPRLMPGNPVQLLIARLDSQGGTMTPKAIRALSVAFGLDTKTGLWGQYVNYWGQLLHGDLGRSITFYPESVSNVISQSLPWTLGLVGVATLMSFVLGTVLGAVVGWRRSTALDSLLPAATFLSAVPYFWMGLVAVTVFGSALRWLPLSGGFAQGMTEGLSGAFISSVLRHSILPAATIVASSMAGWLLGMRNMMVTTLDEDYVMVAQAKGLSERRVAVSYAARNAILPSVAGFALSLGFVVSGALLVEIVFSYPGIGFVLYEAVTNEDYPLMQGIFLIITLTVLAANLVADVVYLAMDPRTRQEA